MGFTCGIVGLPNVGKSTLFNALTSGKAAAANFPFCTIEPNTGSVPVPDPRLYTLADIAKSQKIVPTQLSFIDIAGLIKGASKGEGLGNQFLGHIRTVDAIVHVVRCFKDENVIHVEPNGSIDPVRDLDVIITELILSDYEAVEKQISKFSKVARAGNNDAKIVLTLFEDLLNKLGKGVTANEWKQLQSELPENSQFDSSYKGLLTAKPYMIVANIDEDQIGTANKLLEKINNKEDIELKDSCPLTKAFQYAQTKNLKLVPISGKLESEIAELPKEDRTEYLKEVGLEISGFDLLAISGHELLGLSTFFTVGPKEAHAWTFKSGSSAPQCAGKIHSDFEKGFIRAEVIGYKDYVEGPGELKAKENGKLRVEGKEYIVKDGDIMNIRFNL